MLTDTPKMKAAPVKLEELCKQTRFTKHEIRVMYRGFKQVTQDKMELNITYVISVLVISIVKLLCDHEI